MLHQQRQTLSEEQTKTITKIVFLFLRFSDLPVSRNVDAFNYDTMKTTLLERFDLFNAAPFTIQRLSELLNEPKKHYCRLDKYMRALEKNILGNGEFGMPFLWSIIHHLTHEFVLFFFFFF